MKLFTNVIVATIITSYSVCHCHSLPPSVIFASKAGAYFLSGVRKC
jgi:hypothetical protein